MDANLTNLRTGTVKMVCRRQHTGLGDCTVLDKSPNVSALTQVKRIVKREESRSSRGDIKWEANGTKRVPKLKKEGKREGTKAEAREEGMSIKGGSTKGKKGNG